MTIDRACADELLSTTRAVRKRLDLNRPVEPEVLLDCIRLAQQAPTASNDQTWRWLIVTDRQKIETIARLYAEAGTGYLTSVAERTTDDQSRRVYESALYLTEILPRVPALVIPCVARSAEGPLALAASVWGSILPAAWSFQLALRSRGLGSVWTTLHLIRADEVAELLGIPDGVTQAAMFPVAYTVGTDFQPAKRPPVETIVSWNQWGSSDTQ